jgi:hypothetical protein
MNARILSSVAATLVIASLARPATAEPLGEHPAVLVARAWSSRGIDPNTFIVAPPAASRWVSESPTTKDKAARNPAPHTAKVASASSK